MTVRTKEERRTLSIRAPANFSLVDNPQEMSSLLQQIRTAAAERQYIKMDLSGIGALTPDGIAVFTSQIARQRNLVISGNVPKDPQLKDIFIRSGFYKYVTTEGQLPTRPDQGLIQTQGSELVEPTTANRLVEFAAKKLGMDSGRYKAAYRALIECMSNTHQHAADQAVASRPRPERWWATVFCPEADDRACFTFIDWGVGIVKSLQLKPEWRLLRPFLGSSHDKTLKGVLEGTVNSRTGQTFRGKGLPGINAAAAKERISNVVIISNRAYANVSTREFRTILTPFTGTFVYWEVVHEKDQ